MNDVIKTAAGWIKRLPGGNIGPFTSKEIAKASYASDKKVEGTKKAKNK